MIYIREKAAKRMSNSPLFSNDKTDMVFHALWRIYLPDLRRYEISNSSDIRTVYSLTRHRTANAIENGIISGGILTRNAKEIFDLIEKDDE